MSEPPNHNGDGDRYAKRHLSFDPASSLRLDRLARAFALKPSQVVCRALEFQETGNNRLARHGIREPLQALTSALHLIRPMLERRGDAELLSAIEASLREINERLETCAAQPAR